jgi:hypothetical protein
MDPARCERAAGGVPEMQKPVLESTAAVPLEETAGGKIGRVMARRVEPGRTYTYHRQTGQVEPIAPVPAPDLWICRRLEDFPDGQAPAGAGVGACAECRAPIAFTAYGGARRQVYPRARRLCFQCAGFEPLPFVDATPA